MICTIAVPGVVYLGPSVLAGLASAAATAMALRQLNAAEGEVAREEERSRLAADAEILADAVCQVELGAAQTEAIEGLVAERCHMAFSDGKLTITLNRDVRGRLTVRAHGHGMDRAEVSEKAERFLGMLMQQVAYREVVTKMKRYGLEVQQEARLEDGTVKVRIGGRRR